MPAAAVAATGGSTNAALHLPAIAHEARVRFNARRLRPRAKRTPQIADLQPGGRYLAKDLHCRGRRVQPSSSIAEAHGLSMATA
jgi:dihydroxy-acid dehydratase